MITNRTHHRLPFPPPVRLTPIFQPDQFQRDQVVYLPGG
ncbi:hypothetical protein [Sporisorium scitamineum]|uniref:Uncharacterized protein n=1 Tax=Sporisorium scitamineum TaxID=49012 RepID=A0A0F7RUA1_9BASI|nr:hypothetical protein [Sporisorium scitamineum]